MGVVLHAHSIRGEPRLQRNASGEVATLLRNYLISLYEGMSQHRELKAK